MVINAKHAASLLSEGAVIAIPTETVWGLAARADDPTAVRKILRLKGREEGKPLTLFPQNLSAIAQYVFLNEAATRLIDAGFIPGPLTVVLASRVSWPGLVASDGSIGIRIPKHREIIRLLAGLEFPLATTSANPSGLEPAKNLKELEAYFPDIPALKGESGAQEPSTVLDARSVPLIILRRGHIGLLDIEKATGMRTVSSSMRVLFVCTGGVDRSPAAARWLTDQSISGVEARFTGTLWQEDEVLSLARWADLIFPLESYHKEFLEDIGVPTWRIMKPLGIPDSHGLEEPMRRAIFTSLEKTLIQYVLPEIRARLRGA
ncbi:MAG: L-threonylcarbamoyladenylate synthase [candidate division WOR-3 bacterium]